MYGICMEQFNEKRIYSPSLTYHVWFLALLLLVLLLLICGAQESSFPMQYKWMDDKELSGSKNYK